MGEGLESNNVPAAEPELPCFVGFPVCAGANIAVEDGNPNILFAAGFAGVERLVVVTEGCMNVNLGGSVVENGLGLVEIVEKEPLSPEDMVELLGRLAALKKSIFGVLTLAFPNEFTGDIVEVAAKPNGFAEGVIVVEPAALC